MLRILIRLTSVAFGLLVAVLSWLTVSMVQLSLPLGSQEGAVVLASQTSLGRESWIAGLDRIAAETSTDIFLMAPGQEDYLGRRDIFRFGPAQGQASAHWLMPGLEGTVRPSQELGETSLNTSYALRGPAQGRAAVKDWMASAGIRTNWNTYHSTLVSMSLVGLPILVYASTLVLLSTVVMSWYAQRARSRAVRVISACPARASSCRTWWDLPETSCLDW